MTEIVDLTPAEFAKLVRSNDCVIMPMAIQGYLYAVVKGADDEDIYRVAVG